MEQSSEPAYPPTPVTVKELLAWSYANLAMAHYAVENGADKYDKRAFSIRKRLYFGLMKGTMKMRTIFDDEKVKLRTGHCCNYCGAVDKLSVDHVFARNTGGPDQADNLIYACRSCNSSKGKRDLMEWAATREQFLPLMIVRRYLKLIYRWCEERALLDSPWKTIETTEAPFKLQYLPLKYPAPKALVLSVVARQGTAQVD